MLGVILISMVLFIPTLKKMLYVSNLLNKELIYILVLSFIPTLIIQILFIIRENQKNKNTL